MMRVDAAEPDAEAAQHAALLLAMYGASAPLLVHDVIFTCRNEGYVEIEAVWSRIQVALMCKVMGIEAQPAAEQRQAAGVH